MASARRARRGHGSLFRRARSWVTKCTKSLPTSLSLCCMQSRHARSNRAQRSSTAQQVGGLANASSCTCPTPGSAGCPAWCTRRAAWKCVPWSGCEGWCAERCAPRCCQSAEWFRAKLHSLGVAVPATADPEPPRTRRGAESGGRVRRVMVWQGERNDDGHLSFMYWPIMGTLLSGFQYHAARHPLKLVAGVGQTREYARQLSLLRSSDWFVWVGLNERFSQPWRQLRRRGVRRIYYRTEPGHCTPAALAHTTGVLQGAAPWSKCPPWQCPSSPPVPPQGAPGGSGAAQHSQGEAQPRGAQSPPRGPKQAASKVTDFTAF